MTNKDIEQLAKFNTKLKHGRDIFMKVMAKKGITVAEAEEAHPWLIGLQTSPLLVSHGRLLVAGRVVPAHIIIGEEGQIGKAARSSAQEILRNRRLEMAKKLDDDVRQAELALAEALKRQKLNTLANKRRARKLMRAQLDALMSGKLDDSTTEHIDALERRMHENKKYIDKLKAFIEQN